MNIEATLLSSQEDINDKVSDEDSLIEKVNRLLESSDQKIGFGRTAEVHVFEDNPRVCTKIITPKTIDKINTPRFNSVKLEGELQQEARRISKSVKVPQPLFHTSKFMEDGEHQALVMERLNAATIEDIVNKKVELPQSFNIQTFFGLLRKFFNDLHDLNIHHRDVHNKNIMMDLTTGGPCVIDFGIAIKAFGDENPYREVLSNRDVLITHSDNKQIDALERELSTFLLTISR